MSRFALAAALLCCAAAAGAAEQMKPGLWEMNLKSDAMKNMPKIPPEQLAQMKKMGIAVPQFQDGGMVTRVCISKEMAARDVPPTGAERETGCASKNYQRSGAAYSVDIVCDGPNMKGTGKARGTLQSGTSFTSSYDFQGTMHGQPVNHHQEGSGKWLAADCGSVKPLGGKP